MAQSLDFPEMLLWPDYMHLLGHSNWSGWKRRIRLVCETRGLLAHLDGSTPRPMQSAAHAAQVEVWKRNDSWLRFLLAWNIANKVGISVEGIPAADIWHQFLVKYDHI